MTFRYLNIVEEKLYVTSIQHLELLSLESNFGDFCPIVILFHFKY